MRVICGNCGYEVGLSDEVCDSCGGRLSDRVERLNDENYKELVKMTKSQPIKFHRSFQPEYKGISNKGVIRFNTEGSHGEIYDQTIKLKELGKLKNVLKNKKKLFEKALEGDLEVSCTCPAFLYWGFKYISWDEKFGIEKEKRSPDIRNPEQGGSVCKHLRAVLKEFDQHFDEFISDYKG